jgi:hypothetical protein
MRIQEGERSSESVRTAIDRHAVTTAGQLLMSAISMEHRVRRFSMRLGTLPSQRASAASVARSVTRERDRGLSFVTGRGD